MEARVLERPQQGKGTYANESGCLKGSTRIRVKATIEIKDGEGAAVCGIQPTKNWSIL